eukprot:3034930-Prymnesium_polylepis.1
MQHGAGRLHRRLRSSRRQQRSDDLLTARRQPKRSLAEHACTNVGATKLARPARRPSAEHSTGRNGAV